VTIRGGIVEDSIKVLLIIGIVLMGGGLTVILGTLMGLGMTGKKPEEIGPTTRTLAIVYVYFAAAMGTIGVLSLLAALAIALF
jgi:hypothetical protein